MIRDITGGIKGVRHWFNRSYWAMRLFRLSKSEGTATSPGLVLIQVDGLSRTQLTRGLRDKNLPFLQSLIRRQKYQEYVHYSGLPSNTPSVQGELFYGVKGCVPAFNFVDKKTGKPFLMFDPTCAQEIELRLSVNSKGLLCGGSSYSNIFVGGADESHYCVAAGGWERLLQVFNPITWVLVFIFHLNIFVRTFALVVLEFVIGFYDFFQGVFSGKKIKIEFQFILARALICVLLRELVVLRSRIDIARGLPVIHLNFVGYDEQAHRRGPSSKFAHWSLRGIDDAIKRVWKEARFAERRDYEVWIYSDHGQEDAVSYASVNDGKSIESAIGEIFDDLVEVKKLSQRSHFSHGNRVEHSSAKVIAVGMGPIVHIYPAQELSLEEQEHVISELLQRAHIPVVLSGLDSGKVEARTRTGKFILPEDKAEILGSDHPFLNEAAEDLVALCHHPSAGKIIISGYLCGTKLITFAQENGCHAGYGPEETRGFALLPASFRVPIKEKKYLRPFDIRQAALEYLGSSSGNSSANTASMNAVKSLRFMTYNVHRCKGLDGMISPERIARVIIRQNADVVALQEIDVGLNRSGKIDQAEKIAKQLGMIFYFQSSREFKGGKYGNAILSRFPLSMIRVAPLPRFKSSRFFEPRGALWVVLNVNGVNLNVITSHLSLWPAERLLQAEALLGPEWTGSHECQGPVVLLGDFNASPGSKVCHRIGRKFRDVQLNLDSYKPQSTWLSSHPFSRIDHCFVSEDIKVLSANVPRMDLEKIASDHLPLIVDLKIPEKIESLEPSE